MNDQTAWMVRAGEAGFRFEDFKSGSYVSIGWPEMGDLNGLKSREDFAAAVSRTYPAMRKAQAAASTGQPFRQGNAKGFGAIRQAGSKVG